MDWSNFGTVSDYLETICSQYKRTIKFIGIEEGKSTTQILGVKSEQYPIFILNSLKNKLRPTESNDLVETNSIEFVVFEFTKTADYQQCNEKYSAAKKVAKDIIARINKDFEDDDTFSIIDAVIEDSDYSANIIGVRVELSIRADLIAYDENVWN